LSQLLILEALSDDALIDELLVLLWAGHDTSMAFLTWSVYELAQHPDVVARLRHEQNAICGDRPLQLEQLDQLPLLRAFLREVERLHPPSPGGFRRTREAMSFHGYDIPGGWTLFYATDYTHRMPELWGCPDRFDIDRHLAPRNEGRAPYHLIGFGAGPRVCIGRALAQLELCLIITTLIRRFDIHLIAAQDLRVQTAPVQIPRSGLQVVLDVRR
jgi:cytochrome P450